MAPERIDPQTFGPIGPTTDLYAMGIILFELLAGRPPFQGSMTEIFTGHLMQAPDLGLLPPGLTAVVGKALAKPSSDRYPAALPVDSQTIAPVTIEAFVSPTTVQMPVVETVPDRNMSALQALESARQQNGPTGDAAGQVEQNQGPAQEWRVIDSQSRKIR